LPDKVFGFITKPNECQKCPYDPDHSKAEDRQITMCISKKGRLLIVVHSFREESADPVTIRIISSRKATKQEAKTYGE